MGYYLEIPQVWTRQLIQKKIPEEAIANHHHSIAKQIPGLSPGIEFDLRKILLEVLEQKVMESNGETLGAYEVDFQYDSKVNAENKKEVLISFIFFSNCLVPIDN